MAARLTCLIMDNFQWLLDVREYVRCSTDVCYLTLLRSMFRVRYTWKDMYDILCAMTNFLCTVVMKVEINSFALAMHLFLVSLCIFLIYKHYGFGKRIILFGHPVRSIFAVFTPGRWWLYSLVRPKCKQQYFHQIIVGKWISHLWSWGSNGTLVFFSQTCFVLWAWSQSITWTLDGFCVFIDIYRGTNDKKAESYRQMVERKFPHTSYAMTISRFRLWLWSISSQRLIVLHFIVKHPLMESVFVYFVLRATISMSNADGAYSFFHQCGIQGYGAMVSIWSLTNPWSWRFWCKTRWLLEQVPTILFFVARATGKTTRSAPPELPRMNIFCPLKWCSGKPAYCRRAVNAGRRTGDISTAGTCGTCSVCHQYQRRWQNSQLQESVFFSDQLQTANWVVIVKGGRVVNWLNWRTPGRFA